MRYFAYGSNMNWDVMKKRCPEADYRSVAVLRGHKLTFPRRSSRRRGGVASVAPAAGREVWGVVYDISAADLLRLDAAEAYPAAYDRSEVDILLAPTEAPAKALTYIARPQPDPPRPGSEYMGLLLSGARFWGLPPDYIRDLERVGVYDV